MDEDAYSFEAHSAAGPQRTSDSIKPSAAAAPAGTTFDPRHLLNPRKYQAEKPRVGLGQMGSGKVIATNGAQNETTPSLDRSVQDLENCKFEKKRDHDVFQGEGQGSMIEHMYGVESRESQPQRRAKVKRNERQDNARSSKARFITSGETGLGSYMREDYQKEKAPVSRVETVDLTLGDAHCPLNSILYSHY
jgi:hypothetical protein